MSSRPTVNSSFAPTFRPFSFPSDLGRFCFVLGAFGSPKTPLLHLGRVHSGRTVTSIEHLLRPWEPVSRHVHGRGPTPLRLGTTPLRLPLLGPSSIYTTPVDTPTGLLVDPTKIRLRPETGSLGLSPTQEDGTFRER